jgi:hypothetical protein
MTSTRSIRVTMALLVYVILIFSLQVFLLAVAVEAFLDHDPKLAWSATAISAVLALGSLIFYRSLRRG